jgi:hypothetical protein
MLEQALSVLGVPAKDVQEFEVDDPFNRHVLRGYICRRPDHRYGAMYLTHVNGEEAPQLILATPKLHYPFDRAGTYRFPPAREVLIYEKFDGTNVLAFFYQWRSQKYLTFKLRLSPVIRNSRHGPFLDLWQEVLQAHPEIPRLPEINGCAISFELYGARNKHLVVYDVPLAVAVLFGVDQGGRIRPPADLQLLGVPSAPLAGRLEHASDYQGLYNTHQADCERGNEMLEDGAVRGTEGRVWYMRTLADEVVMFKCKPESVEQIHFAAGAGLSNSIVRATAYNVLETDPEVTYAGVTALLQEDYSDEEIERYRLQIEQVIAEVRAEVQLREQILAAYDALGLNIVTQKGEVMRALSAHFPRALMKKVYSVLQRERAENA